jgi:uncharacterized damage-inducible protein DinB
LTKAEITRRLRSTTEEFHQFCFEIDSDIFFQQPAEKWSVAQNVKHLVISTNATRLAFTLPKFIVKFYAGKPNRPSRSYDELVNKYHLKLQQGGKASQRFIPARLDGLHGKEKLLSSFTHSMTKLVNSIERGWQDDQLDKFIAPHPLLGKITLRELCYFTIHHTHHHLASIKERIAEFQVT